MKTKIAVLCTLAFLATSSGFAKTTTFKELLDLITPCYQEFENSIWTQITKGRHSELIGEELSITDFSLTLPSLFPREQFNPIVSCFIGLPVWTAYLKQPSSRKSSDPFEWENSWLGAWQNARSFSIRFQYAPISRLSQQDLVTLTFDSPETYELPIVSYQYQLAREEFGMAPVGAKGTIIEVWINKPHVGTNIPLYVSETHELTNFTADTKTLYNCLDMKTKDYQR